MSPEPPLTRDMSKDLLFLATWTFLKNPLSCLLHLAHGKFLILRWEFPGDEIEVLCPDSRTGEGVSVTAGRTWRQPVSTCLRSVMFMLATCTRRGLVSPMYDYCVFFPPLQLRGSLLGKHLRSGTDPHQHFLLELASSGDFCLISIFTVMVVTFQL